MRLAIAGIVLTLLAITPPQQRFDDVMPTGRWVGEGRYFKAELQRRHGAVPIDIEFSGDRTSGHVGEGDFEYAEIVRRRDLIEVKARLRTATGKVQSDKDCLVLLITAASDSTLHAEFHLKSNCWFDFAMREGEVVLRRPRTPDRGSRSTIP